MGLATAHGIVLSHGGAITVESRLGEGTVFEVLFPVHQIPDRAPEKEKAKQSWPKGNERILFVDDEEAVVEQGTITLERLGYTVTAHTSSIEALADFQNHPDWFDLVLTDHTMPNLTGLDLAKTFLKIRPGIPVILCSGFSEQLDEESVKAADVTEYVLKPIMPSEMAALVRKTLDETSEKKRTPVKSAGRPFSGRSANRRPAPSCLRPRRL